ncbi:MAG: protein adenylyltransferase SelO [Burkholderiaceae bacterium]
MRNSFTGLPSPFYTRLVPTPLAEPYLVCASPKSAALIGLEPGILDTPAGRAIFTGNAPLPGGDAHAAVYSGHQFGVWAGQLGDGRAITLGEAQYRGHSFEIQLKGAGKTPYSRMGDGRAVLRSSIREFLCSEAMAALCIPTTRALCVIGSDAPVIRESVESAAVVTRLAPSFVRFGSFEHWYYREAPDELKALADFIIDEHYPEARSASNPYGALLEAVTLRTATLMAQWQAVGFCHGVMNTDNMSILGLTLDYGPFGFMEAFDAGYICNHSDTQGRYAYRLQPQIAHWNLYALGQALIPLVGDIEQTRAALEGYKPAYEQAMRERMHAKLGLKTTTEGDAELFERLFGLLQENHADFTLFFRRLGAIHSRDAKGDEGVRDLFFNRPALDAWVSDYRLRLAQEAQDDGARRIAMNAVNPKYVLRNYLAEVAIQRAREHDFSEVQKLLRVLENPFDEQPEHEHYAALPPDWASQLEVSCSS